MKRSFNSNRIFMLIKSISFFSVFFFFLFSCTKPALIPPVVDIEIPDVVITQFKQYTIMKGAQKCDKRAFEKVSYQSQRFIVKFDSSAIYQTTNAANQYDVNKLYGFSDNDQHHHINSARFGWRWSNNALRLFAYVYNNEVLSFKELSTVAIGVEHQCAIQVSDSTYIFTLNGKNTTMHRASTTPTGSGYKLYPYFGGDELAPHDVRIWIKEF